MLFYLREFIFFLQFCIILRFPIFISWYLTILPISEQSSRWIRVRIEHFNISNFLFWSLLWLTFGLNNIFQVWIEVFKNFFQRCEVRNNYFLYILSANRTFNDLHRQMILHYRISYLNSFRFSNQISINTHILFASSF